MYVGDKLKKWFQNNKWQKNVLFWAWMIFGCISCIRVYASDDYIIEDSNIKYLTDADTSVLSLRDINYAKNEIYARHGRKFHSQELQSYFNSKSWYEGTIEPEDFDAAVSSFLTDLEMINADFLQKKEFEIDPDGYPLDSSYETILDEYRKAYAEGFKDIYKYPHVRGIFDPFFSFYRGEKVYYAYYDFLNDGQPELLISIYHEATDAEDAYYTIEDVYGTDGTYVKSLDEENQKGFADYRFCENNILACHTVTGGLSRRGFIYFQLLPNAASGKFIEEIYQSGTGECWRSFSPDENEERIQSFEYEKIIDSYKVMEDIPFEWQELAS